MTYSIFLCSSAVWPLYRRIMTYSSLIPAAKHYQKIKRKYMETFLMIEVVFFRSKVPNYGELIYIRMIQILLLVWFVIFNIWKVRSPQFNWIMNLHDSCLVVLMHTGYCRPTASPPPSAIQELRATVRVLPPQDCKLWKLGCLLFTMIWCWKCHLTCSSYFCTWFFSIHCWALAHLNSNSGFFGWYWAIRVSKPLNSFLL